MAGRVEVKKTPKQSGLSFNYVSDPPGGEQLDRIYHTADSTYVLDKYQIVTAEGTPKLYVILQTFPGFASAVAC